MLTSQSSVFTPTFSKKYAEVWEFAFNGQVKDDEVAGAGNTNTALFWEYDTRSGRRWNLDPIKKAWQSDYSCFSGSPIWKFDPNGDDDFFNSRGEFVKRTNKGTSIYIQTDKGNVKFSEMKTNNMHNRQIMANIASYYASKIGISGIVGIANYPGKDQSKDKSDKILGFEGKNKGLYINAKGGGINSILDDYNNLTSVLFHENIHKTKGHEKIDLTNIEHAKVYLDQIQDITFINTTSSFKTGQIGAFQSLLTAAAKDIQHGNGDFTPLNNLITEANSQSNVTGYKFSLQKTENNFCNTEDNEYKVFATPINSQKKKK